jgi:hypothetical protein
MPLAAYPSRARPTGLPLLFSGALLLGSHPRYPLYSGFLREANSQRTESQTPPSRIQEKDVRLAVTAGREA